MNWQNRHILVAGIGGSGVSMIAYLREAGAAVAAYDENLPPERRSALQERFPNLDCFSGSLKSPLLKRAAAACSAMSKFWRRFLRSAVIR